MTAMDIEKPTQPFFKIVKKRLDMQKTFSAD